MADRNATVVWTGTLTEGQGELSTQSGALDHAPVTWASRMEAPAGKTSPEELLAAAEAECYAMGLVNLLKTEGHPATRIEVKATASIERGDQGLRITTMSLDVSGDVPGIDQHQFNQYADRSEQSCPVSNALRGNVKISVNARLTEPAGR
ncbi:MAG TPA: OsmC family peroxiredoxin [Chloroflexota bacterium]|nr:OsmC family peroxiredoxin [Chloroflexota bacterium]